MAELTERLPKPKGSAVEILYVKEDGGSDLPQYVEVRFYSSSLTPPAPLPAVERIDIPQDGKRYGAYLTENGAEHVMVTLRPL